MTIAEAIEIISDIDKAYRTFSNIEYYSLSTAIDTMRKYQKIEEIMHIEMNGKEALQEIERILRG